METLRRVWAWIDDRAGISRLARPLEEQRVPPDVANTWAGWAYVFGTATLIALLVEVISGVGLATLYVPSTAHAYESLIFITNVVTFGELLRGIHYWGAGALVVLVGIHMARTFITGSYKFPREMNWLSGVILLGITAGFGYTGQLLRWDTEAIWSVVIAAEQASRAPFIGDEIARLILAGETVTGPTLTRFYTAHVLVLPALAGLFVAWHIFLVFYHGISEVPEAGQPVEPETYRARYEKLLERGRPYWPDVAWRDVLFGFAVVVVIVALGFIFGPRDLAKPPDPTIVETTPHPDWYFIWYYALLTVVPDAFESILIVYGPIVVFLILVLLPFAAGKGERSPKKRPWAVGIVVVVAVIIGALVLRGLDAPWVPAFDTVPLIPPEAETDNIVYVGAQLFYTEGCQYCHTVLGRGGRYGPDLTYLSYRLSPHELKVRTLNGFEEMPAYRHSLTLEEVNAIVAFLEALTPPPEINPDFPEAFRELVD